MIFSHMVGQNMMIFIDSEADLTLHVLATLSIVLNSEIAAVCHCHPNHLETRLSVKLRDY